MRRDKARRVVARLLDTVPRVSDTQSESVQTPRSGARTVAGASARYWEPYLTISVMAWVATLGLAWLIHMLEKRLGKGDDK